MRPPRGSRKAVHNPIELTAAERDFVRGLVIHDDGAILALNKPAGLSSQGGRGQARTLDDLLWAFAKPGKARPRLIHRLDRDTSGVILAARTKPGAAFLGKAMMARKLAKTYLAIVAPGAPEPASGVIAAPLRRVEQGREAYMRICEPGHLDAEAALTRYRSLSSGAGAALVELQPETGRMHQLRVHLASIGHPIAGDARYGGALALAGAPVPRLMLHAAALAFPHPDGGVCGLTAPMPAEMTEVITRSGIQPPDHDGALG